MADALVVRLQALVDEFNRDMNSAADSVERVGKAAADTQQQVAKSSEQSRRSVGEFIRENERSFRGMENAGRAMAIGVTAPIAALGTAVARTGTAYNALEQRSRAALTTMLGSAEAATAQMEQLYSFTSESPFPRQTFIEAQQQLIGFGMEAERIIPVLAAVQDAVAATGGSAQDISEVVDVLSRIEGQGKITGVELQRLGIRGIDAANMIADHFGYSADEVRAVISSGAIDAEMAIDALVAGIDKKMGGAAENVKKTWDGATDRVKAAFRDLSSAIVEPFVSVEGGGLAVGWANNLADGIRTLESAYRDLSPTQQTAVVGITGLATAAPVALWAVGRLGRAAINTMDNFRDMGVTAERLSGILRGPLVTSLGAGAVAAGIAWNEFRKLRDETRDAAEDLAETFGQSFDAATAEGQVQAWRAQAEGLRDALKELDGETSTNVFQRILGGFKEITPGMSSAVLEADNLSVAYADMIRTLGQNAERASGIVNEVVGHLTFGADAISITEQQVYALADALGIDLATAARDEAVDALIEAATASEDLGAELGTVGAAAENAAGPLEALGFAAEDLGSVSEETAEKWQQLAGALLSANEAIARSEQENRESAEKDAEKHNAAIDEKIKKLKDGSTEQREELEKQKKTWEDFASDISVEQVTGHLEDINQEFRDWQQDLQTIAGEVGGEVASRLALMGPEWAPIVSQAVDSTADEILRLDAAIADNVSLQLAAAKLAVQMEIFEEIVRQGAEATAESVAESTGIALDVVQDVWSSAGLDPLELMIDSEAAILQVDAAERHAMAWHDREFRAWVDANIDPADRKFTDLNGLLRAYAESNPTANLFARDYATSVIDQVRNRLRELDGSNAFVNVISRGAQIAGVNSRGGITQHDGGLSGTGPRHSGRLGPNEIPVIAERGEFWVNKDATARHLPLLEAINADRFHTGGRVGGRTSYDLGALFGVTRQASFGDAATHLAAIERMRELYAQMTREIEDQQRAERRAELVTARRTAKTREEWSRAVEQMREHDLETKRIVQRRQYEDRLAAAQAAAQLKANREQFEFERMAASEQLRWLDRRLAAEQQFSDEWMRLARQRQQITEQEFQRLNRMLDEQADMLARRRDALGSQLSLDQGDDPWDWQASTITEQVAAQVARLAAWDQAMAEARRRGLSDDALAALGIDGPAALGQLEVLLEATDAELRALSSAIADRNRALAEQAGRDLKGELDGIGQEAGRSWAEAIAEGLASGIPAIVEAARALQQAGTAADPTTMAVRALFDQAGVRYGRHADGSWEDPDTRIARIVADITSGRRTLAQVERSIAALPKFHLGGVVPGPVGREQLALVTGGETFRTPAQEAALVRQVTAPQVVVVETVVEKIPDGATIELHDSRLGDVVLGTIRTAQAQHDRRVAARVRQRKGAR